MNTKLPQLIKNLLESKIPSPQALHSACSSLLYPPHITGALPGKFVCFIFKAHKNCISQKPQVFQIIKLLADVSHQWQSSLLAL